MVVLSYRVCETIHTSVARWILIISVYLLAVERPARVQRTTNCNTFAGLDFVAICSLVKCMPGQYDPCVTKMVERSCGSNVYVMARIYHVG